LLGIIDWVAYQRGGVGLGAHLHQEDTETAEPFVPFVISDITPSSSRFEQSFPDKWWKTWEVNWVETDTTIHSVK
jgi:hypothetical protein